MGKTKELYLQYCEEIDDLIYLEWDIIKYNLYDQDNCNRRTAKGVKHPG